MEQGLVLAVSCTLNLHGFNCLYLIEPRICAAGEKTVELSTYEPVVLPWSRT